jgi:plasmid stability protein
MPAVTIRNLSEAAHRALKMRTILEDAALPEGRLRLGTALREIGRKHDITNADIEAIEQVRDRRPAEPMTFD